MNDTVIVRYALTGTRWPAAASDRMPGAIGPPRSMTLAEQTLVA